MAEEVKALKREIRQKTRIAHRDNIHSIFENKDGDAPGGGLKRFWPYIKKQKKLNSGFPPLKDNVILITDPKGKAKILNKQFGQAFSDGKVCKEEISRQNVPLRIVSSPLYLTYPLQTKECESCYQI